MKHAIAAAFLVIVTSSATMAANVDSAVAQNPGTTTNTPAKAASSTEDVHERWLPSNNLCSSDEIKKSFNLLNVDSLENPQLHFQVLMPADWKSNDVTVTADQMSKETQVQVPLAMFTPAKGEHTVTEVRYQRLPQSISAEEFLKLYARRAGFMVLIRQHGVFNGRPVEEALLKFQSSGGDMLTRLTVIRRGEYVFMLASSTTEHQYENWKKSFGVTAVSFNPGAQH